MIRYGYGTLAVALTLLSGLSGCGGNDPATAPSPIVPAPTSQQQTGELPVAGRTPLDVSGVQVTGPSEQTLDATPNEVATPSATAFSIETDVPCDVAQVLSDHCWKCHGQTPNWGGPMSLTTRADFKAMGVITPTQTVDSLVLTRLDDPTRPMPPGSEKAMGAAERVVLEAWLNGGQNAGTQSSCQLEAIPAEVNEPAPPAAPDPDMLTPSWPGGVRPKETCYEFRKHGLPIPNDDTPHITALGEWYVNFYHKVPWTEPVVATGWRTLYDHTEVLHHWLMYRSIQGAERDGQFEAEIGTHPRAELLAVWAAGGGDETFPEGVGLRMPPPGSLLEIEWHLYNSTGVEVPDSSGIELCVVPESEVDPRFVAGVTWLGTEGIVLPPEAETKLGGTCIPSFRNGGPIHIIKWMPHMHLLGTHMDSWVLRANGTEEHVFSQPFQFDSQIMYNQDPPLLLREGDSIFSQCTWQNTNPVPVTFGQPTVTEMCYQFAFAYPIGSLDAVLPVTLTGSSNACLGIEPGRE